MDASSSSNTGAGPQKRVLPARSRRGGPGLGTCDVDVMILEVHKRKMELEPLVPADTPFLLTTNSSKFSSDSQKDPEATFTINTVANERYFDRPEVLRAFREQQIIQTPDFEAINESSTVGGRFRPRGAEDETAETSDAAYEKRHKKFETFEKRQRLREKEKLKHEHYKLKERIEQLRAMDSSAFMAVPASSFSEPPPEEPLEVEEVALHPNGMVVNMEGERRRKEMLDNALALEKRYSYLLPPDRVRKLAHDTLSHAESHHEDESDTDRIISQIAGPSRKDTSESFKFRLPAMSSASDTPASSPAAVSVPKPSVGRKPKAAPAPVAPAAPKVLATYRAIQTPASYAAQRERAAPPAVDVPPVAVVADELCRSPSPTPPPPTPPPETPVESPVAAPVPVPVAVTSGVRGRKRGRGGRPPNGSLVGRQTKAKATKPVPEPVAEPVAPTFEPNNDGESEKALSEDEETRAVVHSKHPSPEPEPELEPEPEPAAAPLPTPTEVQEEPAPPEEDVEMHAPEDEIQPEHPEAAESSQLTAAPESEASQEPLQDHEHTGPPASETAVEEAAAAPTVDEDSITVRAAKRPRIAPGKRRGRRPRAVSAATASEDLTISHVEPAANISTATGHRKPRGASTYKSASGTEEMTFSVLIMAAIKRESTKREGGKRQNTSFGVPTPLFKEYDFELPEDFFYPEADISRLPKAAEDEPPATQQGSDIPEDPAESDAEVAKSVGSAAEDDGEHAESSEDLEETKEADEGEGSEVADSEATEPMDIEEPDPIKDVPTTRTSTTEPDEDEPEEDELTEEIDIMPEPDNEPGVTPRELSFPIGEDQEEQLEW